MAKVIKKLTKAISVLEKVLKIWLLILVHWEKKAKVKAPTISIQISLNLTLYLIIFI